VHAVLVNHVVAAAAAAAVQGSHVASAEEKASHELRLLGAARERVAEVSWHEAKAEGLVAVGSNHYHPWLGEEGGGFYLACGSLEPHYFAGVTGAHKTLTVGVWSYDSLRANHAGAMSADSGGLRLAGNPVCECDDDHRPRRYS
jgi:nickel-dependent lactate racemase